MLFLTAKQHQEVLRRLLDLGRRRVDNTPSHSEGFEYNSLMACFILQNFSSADTLLRMSDSFGREWFPVTTGYAIARTMFEIDVTAHYISQSPKSRAQQYIAFGRVLNKRRMDACSEHRNSKNPSWREAMALVWQNDWAPREHDVAEKFNAVAAQFQSTDKKGRQRLFQTWSGKTLRQMAIEVDHVEAYDIFYTELSSFTHGDVHLADRFLQRRPEGPFWSQRADEFDVGNVFRHAAIFLTCYMEMFARQFKQWDEKDVQLCWNIESVDLMRPIGTG